MVRKCNKSRGIQYFDNSRACSMPIPRSPPGRPRLCAWGWPTKSAHSQRRRSSACVHRILLSATLFLPHSIISFSAHPLLLQLHHVLSLAHALLTKATHAHRTWVTLVEPTRASEMCLMHLMLWRSASWHDKVLLLVSVAFLLRGHVCRFTPAPFRVALLMHATLILHLHHAFILHTALVVQALFVAHATVLFYATLIVHTAPVVIPLVSLCLCLGLLLRLPLRNKRLFLSHGILAT